jgi:hypothetical protein
MMSYPRLLLGMTNPTMETMKNSLNGRHIGFQDGRHQRPKGWFYQSAKFPAFSIIGRWTKIRQLRGIGDDRRGLVGTSIFVIMFIHSAYYLEQGIIGKHASASI